MKRYLKDLIILLVQLMVFYILPLYAGPIDSMGLVILEIILTFILSLIEGIVSNNKLKYFYCIVVSIIFIPSIYIYYNESAFVYILWYLVINIVGLLIGTLIRKIVWKKK